MLVWVIGIICNCWICDNLFWNLFVWKECWYGVIFVCRGIGEFIWDWLV